MNSPTNFLPPQAVISNGLITGNQWQNTDNIFYVDGNYANSNSNQGSASDFCIGNFNFNIPVGSIILGIEIEIIGLTGAGTTPPVSLDVAYFNDTDGANAYFPYTSPITSLTPVISTVTIGSPTYLFGTSWTVDQINNFKLSLTANGDILLDSVLVKVYFTPPATNTFQYNSLAGGTFQVAETITDTFSGATATVVTDNGSNEMTVTNVVGYFQPGDPIVGQTSGATALLDAPIPGVCIDCSSPIQVQAMELALPFLIGQTAFYLKAGSFAYPNGIPVQPGDLGSCGGTIPFVFDESKSKQNGQNFEENAMLDINNGGSWVVLASGVIKVELGSINQRGLDFKTPANHVDANMSNHDANSKVIISNNEPYNLTLIRRCQADTVFSVPISVYNGAILLSNSVHKIIFTGAGVVASLSALHEITVTIPGGGSGSGHIIEVNGSAFTAEPALNFINFFIGTDVAGVSTNINLDVVALANDNTFINALTSNINFQNAVKLFTSGAGNIQIDQTPLGTGSTFGLIVGTVSGGTVFNTSLGSYLSSKMQVFLNGIEQPQGTGGGGSWFESDPSTGEFTFNNPLSGGDEVTVVYQTSSASIQAAIQFDDESGNPLNTLPGTIVDEFEITGTGVTASILGTKVTYTIAQSGGNGSLLGATQFLAIGVTGNDPSGGGAYSRGTTGNLTLTDVNTKRLYFPYGQDTTGLFANQPNRLEFWKNDFGSFYQEQHITITAGMLTQSTVSAFVVVTSIIWTKDDTHIFAIVRYHKTNATTYTAIDVLQWNIDGTGQTSSSLYFASGTATGDNIISNTRSGAYSDGTNLFLFYHQASGSLDQFREYTIGSYGSAINTYTLSGIVASGTGGLSYDAGTSTFYNYGGNSFGKYQISGSILSPIGSPISYPELDYYNNVPPGSVLSNVSLVTNFQSTSYTLYFVYQILGSIGSSPQSTQTSYVLQTVTFPKI